jgi:hypothetical protein
VDSWPTFFAAELGASATLTGLVVVGISVNLARIVATPQLPGRAAEVLILLGSVLVIASLALVPGQPGPLLGGELLAIGGVCFAVPLAIQLRAVRHSYTHALNKVARGLISVLVSLPLIAAGALLAAGDAHGLYWAAGGMILSLVAGLVGAWVLLVEIVR